MGDVFSSLAEEALRAHLRAAAIRAGEQLGIFARLEEEARSIDELAWHLGLASTHRLQALLDVLVWEQLLLRDKGGEDASFSLPKRIAHSAHIPPLYWGRLAEVIRSDAPLDEPGIRGEGAADSLHRFHAHLLEAGAAAARELMEPLARKFGGTLLDLGSGAGAYAKAWLDAREQVRAVLIDRPEVLELARDPLHAVDWRPDDPRSPDSRARAQLLPLDLLGGALWPEARVVLLANLLHLFGPEDAQALVSRAAAAAEPGGLLIVKDLLLEQHGRGPGSGVFFSLNMALFTAAGRVHTREALRGFLEDAGLESIELRQLDSAPDAIVAQGRKSARASGGGK